MEQPAVFYSRTNRSQTFFFPAWHMPVCPWEDPIRSSPGCAAPLASRDKKQIRACTSMWAVFPFFQFGLKCFVVFCKKWYIWFNKNVHFKLNSSLKTGLWNSDFNLTNVWFLRECDAYIMQAYHLHAHLYVGPQAVSSCFTASIFKTSDQVDLEWSGSRCVCALITQQATARIIRFWVTAFICLLVCVY